jgi:hypothetical protein
VVFLPNESREFVLRDWTCNSEGKANVSTPLLSRNDARRNGGGGDFKERNTLRMISRSFVSISINDVFTLPTKTWTEEIDTNVFEVIREIPSVLE